MSASYVIEADPASELPADVNAACDLLLERWPTPDMGGDVDETPWASDPERRSDGSIVLDVSVSALEEVLPEVYAAARQHGCRVFDAQAGDYLAD